MKAKYLIKIVLLLAAIAVLFWPAASLAQDFPGNIKNWNEPSSNALGAVSAYPATETTICAELFRGNETNIFATVLCDLIKIVSSSVANFASDITCSIQTVGNAGNYKNLIKFESTNGTCTPSNGWGQGENIFGEKAPRASGFYATQISALTQSLQSGTISTAFNITRGIMTVIAVIALFIIAFANILHININTYAIKKMIPTIVVAIIGGFFSLTIIMLFSRVIDFLYSLNIFSPYEALHPMYNIFNGPLTQITPGSATATSNSLNLVFDIGNRLISGQIGGPTTYSFVTGFLGTLLLLIPAVVVFIFEYTLALRPFVIGLLAITAPFAFACLILPQTQIIFRKWWTFLLIALFYAPAVNFTFYVVNVLTQNAQQAGGVGFIAIWAFKVALIAFLVRLPFTIESDIRRLAVRVGKTSFGASLGLARYAAAEEMKVKAAPPTELLKSEAARKIVAEARPGALGGGVRAPAEVEKIKTKPFIARTTLPEIAGLLSSANQTNLGRSNQLLLRSAADLSPDTFRAVLDQSDLKLWRDTRLIEQLKRKDGQILDEAGAAIRADSARKLVRLAQTVTADKLANPEVIKALATKGALQNLPLAVVQRALREGVLQKGDLVGSFAQQTEKVFSELQRKTFPAGAFLTPEQAKGLMAQDQKDYLSGFKDLTGLFANVVRDARVIPPPPAPVIKEIIHQMRSTQSDIFEKNSGYYLQRLGGLNRDASKTIVATMKSAGTPAETALALATNPRIDFTEAKNYVPREKLTPETLALMREGFLNRDLSSNLTGEISQLVVQEKKVIGTAITDKLAENVKVSGADLDTVKAKVGESVKKLSQATSPEEAKTIAKEIDQYYPGPTIRVEGAYTKEDIEKAKSKGESVLEVIEGLTKGGIDKDTLVKDPAKAKAAVETQAAQTVQQMVSSEVAGSKTMEQELANVGAKTPPKNNQPTSISGNLAKAAK